MSDFRFKVGAVVMCNLGSSGWMLGRVIALHYREDHWPTGKTAPYQVALEADHALIYVPEDDARYCREATQEDLRIARRMDALAAPPPGSEASEPEPSSTGPASTGPASTGPASTGLAATGPASSQLGCGENAEEPSGSSYRSGRCHGCDGCPCNWSAVELYSEHYRCVARNGLKVTRRELDLGTIRVGDALRLGAPEGVPTRGFMQCPTLVRLPPGVRFSDDGALTGEVRYDPHRGPSYRVEFVAVSTVDWKDPTVGIVRLEITFVVEANEPPDEFELDAFQLEQREARATAKEAVRDLVNAWLMWEQGELDNRETCDQMLAELDRLRRLLELHPRLDGGRWWVQLGGFHMNVHKLLENALFECELYLGHALTFGDAEVRRMAEQNLEGCYQKRLLEAARFMWMDGVEQMMQGNWVAAADTLRLAAAKKNGWGWAVNYGDIWMSESAARLVHGAELLVQGDRTNSPAEPWLAAAASLLELALARVDEGGVFGAEGHPWACEIAVGLATLRSLVRDGADIAAWLESFKLRTVYWCAQVLGGAAPFPPKPRPRRENAASLRRRLPGHIAVDPYAVRTENVS